MSGMVQDWLQVALEQEDRGIHHAWLYFWPSFVKEMHTYFGIPNVVAEAAHSLDHLHMNPDDWITTYNVALLQYSAQLQWPKSALCHKYYFELPDCIQISFPLVKEITLPLSRLYIPQQSPSTIISGSGNASLEGLHTLLRNVLHIWSVLSLSLICH